MLKPYTLCVASACIVLACVAASVRAQDVLSTDEVMNGFRERTDIGTEDQRRITDWVEGEIQRFTGFLPFRQRFAGQYNDAKNSEQFRIQLAAQTAQVAVQQFAKPDLDGNVAHALAQVLTDMNVPETFPGLIAGLKSSDVRARYFCAKGLTALHDRIADDRGRLDQTVQALRETGLAETDPVVLGRVYEALAFPGQVADVFDAYLALFDKRLTARRGSAVVADGAENYAYELFRASEVSEALSADQKPKLVARLAVFLRMDAERYNNPNLKFEEIDRLERALDGVEDILTRLVGDTGGKIREELSSGGYGNRAAVLQEAYKWVGSPETGQAGALNTAPWNVPPGAP